MAIERYIARRGERTAEQNRGQPGGSAALARGTGAVYHATGQRVRDLPLMPAKLLA